MSQQLAFRGIRGSQAEGIRLQFVKLADIMQNRSCVKKIGIQERVNGNNGFGHLEDRPAVMQKAASGRMVQFYGSGEIQQLLLVCPENILNKAFEIRVGEPVCGLVQFVIQPLRIQGRAWHQPAHVHIVLFIGQADPFDFQLFRIFPYRDDASDLDDVAGLKITMHSVVIVP